MKIKVATSNIRFANPKDGIHDWPNRREVLAHFLNDFGPDLLATQEGREGQIRDLHTILNNLEMVDRSWITERMYPTLFYNPKKLELLDSGDIWLSETPNIPGSKSFDSAFPRLCTWAKFKIIESHFTFFKLNCHLDHIRKKTRFSQINVLIDEFQKINSENLPFIFSGDFNESPFETVREAINGRLGGIVDPWSLLNLEECPTHHNFGGDLQSGNRIDWILYKGPFQANKLELKKGHIEGIYPSDHHPLFLELEVQN